MVRTPPRPRNRMCPVPQKHPSAPPNNFVLTPPYNFLQKTTILIYNNSFLFLYLLHTLAQSRLFFEFYINGTSQYIFCCVQLLWLSARTVRSLNVTVCGCILCIFTDESVAFMNLRLLFKYFLLLLDYFFLFETTVNNEATNKTSLYFSVYKCMRFFWVYT